jgi:hypothetical protein
MFKTSPLDLRKSLTTSQFQLHLYRLSIKSLQDLLDDFDSYGMQDDCVIILDVLNEKINSIITRID